MPRIPMILISFQQFRGVIINPLIDVTKLFQYLFLLQRVPIHPTNFPSTKCPILQSFSVCYYHHRNFIIALWGVIIAPSVFLSPRGFLTITQRMFLSPRASSL